MSNHARLGPSNHRWVHCPGSIREEKAYPNTTNEAAIEAAIDGTGTHLLFEMCLMEGKQAHEFQSRTIGIGHKDNPMGWFVDTDRIERVQLALKYVSERVDNLLITYPKSEVKVEAESLSDPGKSFGRDDWWGTCDVTITVTKSNVILYIEVIDYKDGRIYVDVNNNSQLISYLWGKASNQVTLKTAVMTIIQPKIEKKPIRSQIIDYSELHRLALELSYAAKKTDNPEAALVAGKHCRWCKHKPNCNAEDKQYNEAVKKMNSGMIERVATSLETMDSNELAEILNAKKAFIDAFTKAEIEAERRIELGGFVPGYYMGAGNNKAVWNEDEEVIVKKLKGMKLPKDEIYPAKLISPAQARKASSFSKRQLENLEDLISTVAGKTSLQKGTAKDPKELFGNLPGITDKVDTTAEDQEGQKAVPEQTYNFL